MSITRLKLILNRRTRMKECSVHLIWLTNLLKSNKEISIIYLYHLQQR